MTFIKVSNNLWRGSAPSVKDVILMNKKYKITRIISLDKQSGNRINRVCKLLNIDHITVNSSFSNKNDLLKIFTFDFKKIFKDTKNTFVHCFHGKDRTGLFIALYRIKIDGWNFQKSISEALKNGFGFGINIQKINYCINLLKKLYSNNKDNNFVNDGSIVDDVNSNSSANEDDYSNYVDNYADKDAWSPISDYRIERFPETDQYLSYPETYYNRQNRNLSEEVGDKKPIPIPQIGTYDVNTQGINGAGPSMIGSGIMP